MYVLIRIRLGDVIFKATPSLPEIVSQVTRFQNIASSFDKLIISLVVLDPRSSLA